MERLAAPRWRHRFANQLRTVALMSVLAAAVAGAGALLGPGWAIAGLGLALALNLLTYLYSDRIVLRMSDARPVSRAEEPELHAMVDELAAKAGIPRPRVFVTPEVQPNAFATGRSPAHGVVAVTEGLLRLLPPRELRAVIAHELAHIKHRDVLVATLAGAMASAISWLATTLSFSALFGSDEEEDAGAGGLVFALLAPIGATLVQLGVSRSREYLADAEAARLCGDPEALARALERLAQATPHAQVDERPEPATASLRIANPLAGGGLLAWFSTHPPIAERARRLRALVAPGPAREPVRLGRLRWQEPVA